MLEVGALVELPDVDELDDELESDDEVVGRDVLLVVGSVSVAVDGGSVMEPPPPVDEVAGGVVPGTGTVGPVPGTGRAGVDPVGAGRGPPGCDPTPGTGLIPPGGTGTGERLPVACVTPEVFVTAESVESLVISKMSPVFRRLPPSNEEPSVLSVRPPQATSKFAMVRNPRAVRGADERFVRWAKANAFLFGGL